MKNIPSTGGHRLALIEVVTDLLQNYYESPYLVPSLQRNAFVQVEIREPVPNPKFLGFVRVHSMKDMEFYFRDLHGEETHKRFGDACHLVQFLGFFFNADRKGMALVPLKGENPTPFITTEMPPEALEKIKHILEKGLTTNAST